MRENQIFSHGFPSTQKERLGLDVVVDASESESTENTQIVVVVIDKIQVYFDCGLVCVVLRIASREVLRFLWASVSLSLVFIGSGQQSQIPTAGLKIRL